ncbi:hypothetical protein BJV74DRAFT_335155 [Russula compacta]|nr:hypothetical protein BJV74DRAFT_335155 [Russula compacta]
MRMVRCSLGGWGTCACQLPVVLQWLRSGPSTHTISIVLTCNISIVPGISPPTPLHLFRYEKLTTSAITTSSWVQRHHMALHSSIPLSNIIPYEWHQSFSIVRVLQRLDRLADSTISPTNHRGLLAQVYGSRKRPILGRGGCILPTSNPHLSPHPRITFPASRLHTCRRWNR